MRDLTLRLVVDDSQKTKLAAVSAAVSRAQADIDSRFSSGGLLRFEMGLNRVGQAAARVGTASLAVMTTQVGALTSAMMKLSREFVTVNEKFGGLQLTLGSALKSMSAARQITAEIARLTAASPLPFQNIADVAQSFSVIPQTSNKLAEDIRLKRLGTDKSFLKKALQTVESMNVFRPDQDAASAIFAIREALGGQTRSLIRRFDIPSSLLSAVSGNSMKKLQATPDLMFDAINKLFTSIISPEAIAKFARQPRNLMDNFMEQVFEIPLLKLGTADYKGQYEKLVASMYLSPYEMMLTKASDYYTEVVEFMNTTFEEKLLKPLRSSLTAMLDKLGASTGGLISNLLDRLGVEGKGAGIERIASAAVKGIDFMFSAVSKTAEVLSNPKLIDSFFTFIEGMNSLAQTIIKAALALSQLHPVLGPLAVAFTPALLMNLGSFLRFLSFDLPKGLNNLAQSAGAKMFGVSNAGQAYVSAKFNSNNPASGLMPSVFGQSILRNVQVGSGANARVVQMDLEKEAYSNALFRNRAWMARATKALSSANLPLEEMHYQKLIDQQLRLDKAAWGKGSLGIHGAYAKDPNGFGWAGAGKGDFTTQTTQGAWVRNRAPNGRYAPGQTWVPAAPPVTTPNTAPSARFQGIMGGAMSLGTSLLSGAAIGVGIAGLTMGVMKLYEVMTENSKAVAANTEAMNAAREGALSRTITRSTVALGNILGKSEEEIYGQNSARISKEAAATASLLAFLKNPMNVNGVVGQLKGSGMDSISTTLNKAGIATSEAKNIIDLAESQGLITADLAKKARESSMTIGATYGAGGSYTGKQAFDETQAMKLVVDSLRGKAIDPMIEALTKRAETQEKALSEEYLRGIEKKFGTGAAEILLAFSNRMFSGKDTSGFLGMLDNVTKTDDIRQSIDAIRSLTQSQPIVDARTARDASLQTMFPMDEAVTEQAKLKRDYDQLSKSLSGMNQTITDTFADRMRAGSSVIEAMKIKAASAKGEDAKRDKEMLKLLGAESSFYDALTVPLTEVNRSFAQARISLEEELEKDQVSFAISDGVRNAKDFVTTEENLLRSFQAQTKDAVEKVRQAIPDFTSTALVKNLPAFREAVLSGDTQLIEHFNDSFSKMLAQMDVTMEKAPTALLEGQAFESEVLASTGKVNDYFTKILEALNALPGQSPESLKNIKALITLSKEARKNDPLALFVASSQELSDAYDPATGRIASNASPTALSALSRLGISNTSSIGREAFGDKHPGEEEARLLRTIEARKADLALSETIRFDAFMAGRETDKMLHNELQLKEQIEQLDRSRLVLKQQLARSAFDEAQQAYDPSTGRIDLTATREARDMIANADVTDTNGAKRMAYPTLYGGDRKDQIDRQTKLTASLRDQAQLEKVLSDDKAAATEYARLEVEYNQQLNDLLIERESLVMRFRPSAFLDGFAESLGYARQGLIDFANIGQQVGQTLQNSLGSAFSNIAQGTETVSQAFKAMARNILSSIADILAKEAAAQLLGMLFSSFFSAGTNSFGRTGTSMSNMNYNGNLGGTSFGVPQTPGTFVPAAPISVGTMSTGGPIMGGSGVRDDVPILAMGGEYVINRRAAQMLGRDTLDRLNSGQMQGYANGGYVGAVSSPSYPSSSVSAPSRNVTVNITINKDGKGSNEVSATSDDTAQTEMFRALGMQIEGMIEAKLIESQRTGNLLNPVRQR